MNGPNFVCLLSLTNLPLHRPAPPSESWRDVEELLLGHSFFPQRGVHPLLRRLRHQAVRGRRSTLLRTARQLRWTLELVASSPPSLCRYILVQIFTVSVLPSLSSRHSTPFSLVFLLLKYMSLFISHGLRSMILTQPHHDLQYCCCCCVRVHHYTIPPPPSTPVLAPRQLLVFLMKMYKWND